ncbi:type IV conjugative transfer system protein TraE [Salmonella enterica subsp. enterica serovar Kentucky]|nr:type IV conjugative transfer system protein TraE [Salmonella enterica subsp. enterica serovar Kentucky]
MSVKAQISGNKVVGYIIVGLLFFLALSLTSNIYLEVTNRALVNKREKIVVPMAFDAPFVVSESEASAPYLQMMALSFLSLRLNVSPETVDMNHGFLLSYVRAESHGDFAPVLDAEAKRIKDNAVTSAFYQTAIKVYPSASIVDIRGVLKTWIGNSKPLEEIKHYRLQLSYRAGVTSIEKFVEVDDAKSK